VSILSPDGVAQVEAAVDRCEDWKSVRGAYRAAAPVWKERNAVLRIPCIDEVLQIGMDLGFNFIDAGGKNSGVETPSFS
jgi:hypothetical protein